MKHNKMLSVRLPDGYIIKISKVAKREKVTISELVRNMIEKYLR